VRLLRPRSFLRTGLPASLWSPLDWLPNPRSGTPRSGYRGSDLVQWHLCPVDCDAAFPTALWGTTDVELNAVDGLYLTHKRHGGPSQSAFGYVGLGLSLHVLQDVAEFHSLVSDVAFVRELPAGLDPRERTPPHLLPSRRARNRGRGQPTFPHRRRALRMANCSVDA